MCAILKQIFDSIYEAYIPEMETNELEHKLEKNETKKVEGIEK